MVVLRYLFAAAVMVAAVAASEPSKPAPRTALDQFRVAVALPGTGMSAMTRAQAARMACQVNGCLTGNPRDASSLGSFESIVCCARQNGMACVRRATARGRTIKGVCREMGVLVQRQQELERDGRRPEVGARLRELAEARRNGASEEQVQAMARACVARGELCPGADEECRTVQQRLDGLTREMVEAVRHVAGYVRAANLQANGAGAVASAQAARAK